MSSHAATITPTKNALIDSGKLFLPKAKPSKIKSLDSRLRGNDDFLSVSPIQHRSCVLQPVTLELVTG